MIKGLFIKKNQKGEEVKTVKKLLVVLAAAILVMSSMSAHAFNIPAGEWNAHFTDFSSIYNAQGVPQQAGYMPQPGDWLKAIINLEQVVPKGGGLPVWQPTATEQIAGVEYGFEFLGGIVAGTTYTSYWGPVTEPQSRVELYQRNPFAWNTGPGFAPQTGPGVMGAGPGAPGIVAGINEPGVSNLFLGLQVLLHPDQTIPGATLVLSSNIANLGLGSGDMYLVADSGWYADKIEEQILGPAQIPADMYLKFSYNVNPPLYGWTVRSQDPGEFSIPEPGTILLLGSSLLGLGFLVRRRKI